MVLTDDGIPGGLEGDPEEKPSSSSWELKVPGPPKGPNKKRMAHDIPETCSSPYL